MSKVPKNLASDMSRPIARCCAGRNVIALDLGRRHYQLLGGAGFRGIGGYGAGAGE
jgi:hypothetical protein